MKPPKPRRPRRARAASPAWALPPAYWSHEPARLLEALASGAPGLSAAEAARRVAACGPNVLSQHRRVTAAGLLARQFSSPLVLILVFGALLAMALDEWVEAWIILTIIAGSGLLSFSQEYRASRALDDLLQRLALNAQVWRDGELRTVAASLLAPGDVLQLTAGNLVPADGVVLESRDFLVTEASLTGESFPVEKRAGPLPAEAALAERSNCVHMGTSVRSGWARVLVVITGRETVVGGIAHRLESAPDETSFEQGARHFGAMLMKVMVFTVLAVMLVNQFLGRPAVDSLLFAMALAVGISPELLPAIISVTLSHGAQAMAREGVLVKKLQAIENLGGIDVLCTDKTGTLTLGTAELTATLDPSGRPSPQVLLHAYVNAALETGIDNPLDASIVAAGSRAGLSASSFIKVDEIPYDFERRRLTVVVKDPQHAAGHLLISKGAFDNVLAACSEVREDGGAPSPLSEGRRQALAQLYRDRSREGCRVLGLATRRLSARQRYGREDESSLCFEGFLLFFDPPKAGAAEAIQALARLHVRVKIITGDNRHVAAHVARQVGLDAAAIRTGGELAALRDEALWHVARHTVIFAEIDPQQKERIVRALQHSGHAVGYLGDGINDVPALHAADIGISVDGAVDIARETADVVLTGRDLDVLRKGMAAGRESFANTLKYVSITTSANFGNMISMALATPFLPFMPLLAKQILLNNLLSDLPSMAISTDAVDRLAALRPQRWNIAGIRRFMIVFGLISTAFDMLSFALLITVFDTGEETFHTAWFVISLLTELSVVLVLRTRAPVWGSAPAPLLLWATVAVACCAIALPYSGWVAALFGFVPLPLPVLGASLGVCAGYVLATEAAKHWFHRGTRSTSRRA